MISKISKTNTVRLSNGDRILRANMESNIRVQKSLFVSDCQDNGTCYCWDCGTTNDRLTCSHIVSVARCVSEGKAEQSWNVANLELLCIGCHRKWENEKKLNKKRKEYIEYYGKL
jgi:5-methylcytosine-specific restriction endonuclease McrA